MVETTVILFEELKERGDLIRGLIKGGGVVAYPTETFYGLGADPRSDRAVERVQGLKSRPEGTPLPLIAASREALLEVVDSVSEEATLLIDGFWPGPLTILFKVKEGAGLAAGVTGTVTGRGPLGYSTVAIRVPGSPRAREVADLAGGLITATSANPSGAPPAETLDEALAYFDGRVDMVVGSGGGAGAGDAPGGTAILPSTLVDLSNGVLRVLREGAIPEGELLKVLSRVGR